MADHNSAVLGSAHHAARVGSCRGHAMDSN